MDAPRALRPEGTLTRLSLRLPTRLTLARSGKLAGARAPRKHRHRNSKSARKHGISCKASEPGKAATLRRVAVSIQVAEGDTLESLSAKCGISKAKIQAANQGETEVMPGQELTLTIKVPDGLMPTQTGHGIKFVPVEAAYSDDEQEAGLAQEHNKVKEMEAHVGVESAQVKRDVLGTARYIGGGIGKVGLLLLGLSAAWRFLGSFDTRSKGVIKSHLNDPYVRAEIERRHGRSFLDHLDLEDAEHEAEEVFQRQQSQGAAAAAAGSTTATEQHRLLQEQHAAALAQQASDDSVPGAAAAGGKTVANLSHSDQQQQHQQQQHHRQQQQQQRSEQLLHSQHHQHANGTSASLNPQFAPGQNHRNFSKTSNASTSNHRPAAESHVGHQAPPAAAAGGAASAATAATNAKATEASSSSSQSPSPSSVRETSSLPQANHESSSQSSTSPVSSSTSSQAAAAAADLPAIETGTTPADDVAAAFPWVDSELLYIVTNALGQPMNCQVAEDAKAGEEEQQCLLAFEADGDLRQMLYKTAAFVSEDMGASGESPLALLAECVEGERLLAVVHEGAAADLEHVVDAREWLQQLLASSTVLTADIMSQILLTRIDQLQALYMQNSMTGAEADTAADADKDADSAADSDQAAAPTTGMQDSQNSMQGQDKGVSHASSMSHADSAGSNGSTSPAAASSVRQAGERPVKERANAYAAMQRKEVVHISKDSLNQLNQVSIAPQGSSTESRQSAAAIQASQNGKHSSGNAVSSNGGPELVSHHTQVSQNDLKAISLDETTAPGMSHSDSGDSRLQSAVRPRQSKSKDESWQRLSHVCVPVIMFRDGSMGYVTADMADGDVSEKHMLAFQSRTDAEQARFLVQANLNSHEAKVHVVPMKPEQLQESASDNEYMVTVYGPGQLELKPGMTFEQMREAAVSCQPFLV